MALFFLLIDHMNKVKGKPTINIAESWNDTQIES